MPAWIRPKELHHSSWCSGIQFVLDDKRLMLIAEQVPQNASDLLAICANCFDQDRPGRRLHWVIKDQAEQVNTIYCTCNLHIWSFNLQWTERWDAYRHTVHKDLVAIDGDRPDCVSACLLWSASFGHHAEIKYISNCLALTKESSLIIDYWMNDWCSWFGLADLCNDWATTRTRVHSVGCQHRCPKRCQAKAYKGGQKSPSCKEVQREAEDLWKLQDAIPWWNSAMFLRPAQNQLVRGTSVSSICDFFCMPSSIWSPGSHVMLPKFLDRLQSSALIQTTPSKKIEMHATPDFCTGCNIHKLGFGKTEFAACTHSSMIRTDSPVV